MKDEKQPSVKFVKKGKKLDADVLPKDQDDKIKDDDLETVAGGYDPPYECMCTYV